MSRFARVTSIEVLQTIAVALQKFRGECASALDDLDIELQRAAEWIHHDRKAFWTAELRRREDRVAEARVQLIQAQTAHRVGDQRPSCIDEQRALERAKRRRQTAEERIKAVQRWGHTLDRAIDACRRDRTEFAVWLESELQKAVSELNRMSDSLENYIAVEVPLDPHAPVVLSVGGAEATSEAGTPAEPDKNPPSTVDASVQKDAPP